MLLITRVAALRPTIRNARSTRRTSQELQAWLALVHAARERAVVVTTHGSSPSGEAPRAELPNDEQGAADVASRKKGRAKKNPPPLLPAELHAVAQPQLQGEPPPPPPSVPPPALTYEQPAQQQPAQHVACHTDFSPAPEGPPPRFRGSFAAGPLPPLRPAELEVELSSDHHILAQPGALRSAGTIEAAHLLLPQQTQCGAPVSNLRRVWRVEGGQRARWSGARPYRPVALSRALSGGCRG